MTSGTSFYVSLLSEKGSAESAISTLLLVSFMSVMGFAVTVPVFSFFALQDLHMTAFQLGIVMSANEVLQLLSSISSGRLADSFGRRIVYCLCLSWITVCVGTMSIVQNFWQLLIVRAAAGIGQIGEPLASTMVTDLFPAGKERALSLGRLYLVVSIAFVVGSTLATASIRYVGFSHRQILMLSSVFTFLAAVCGSCFLIESLPSNQRRPFFHSQSATESMVYFWNVGLTWTWAARFFASFAVITWYSTYAAFVKDTLGWSAIEFGYILIASGILGAIVQGIFYAPVAQLCGRHGTAIIGLMTYAVSLMLMSPSVGVSVVAHLCVCGCASIGIALSAPAFPDLVGAYVIESGHMGVAQGWVAGAKSIGMIVGPMAAGFLFDHQGPFIANACGTCAATLACACIVAAYTFGKEVRHEQDAPATSSLTALT